MSMKIRLAICGLVAATIVFSGGSVRVASADGLPFGNPSFDSGWFDLTAGSAEMITHDLWGYTDDYVVYVEGRNSISGDRHAYYGMDRGSETAITGFCWLSLTLSTISVLRAEDDTTTDQARVRIWVVGSADYDSGWRDATSGSVNLTHNLGGDIDDYFVYMEMNSISAYVNHVQYGRDRYRDSGGVVRNMGSFWHNLTTSAIDITRGSASTHANDVRIRIWRKPTPAYDSGWFSIAQAATVTKNHNLGGPWNDYVVDLQFKDTDQGYGINQRSYGRDYYWSGSAWVFYGGHWRSLKAGTIDLWRGSNDNDADQMRVRIWTTSAPKYDSGWEAVSQNSGRFLSHDIGGDPDAYYVDLQFRDGSNGVNQINYGCDFQYASGRRYDYGADWSILTASQIYIHRYADDANADEMRVRIWVAPFPDFTSGWEVITPGSSEPFYDSGGTDSVVALDQKDSGMTGMNARFTGIDRYSSDGVNVVEKGTLWRGVDSSHVTIYRGLDDTSADEARVRMWRPPTPAYDSWWTSVDAGTSMTLTHGLGTPTDDMVVEMHFSRLGWINGISYGTDNYSSGGSLVQEGGYWRSLTSDSLVVRRESDAYDASSIRARIWNIGSDTLFEDGFESGNTSAWSSTTP